MLKQDFEFVDLNQPKRKLTIDFTTLCLSPSRQQKVDNRVNFLLFQALF